MGPFGADKMTLVRTLQELIQSARAGFRERFGDDLTIVAWAPGRVNLIGEHTDYNEGYVFPAAIDRFVVVAAAPAPDASKAWSAGLPEPAVFDTAAVSPMHGWARFPSGCAWTLLREGRSPTNINAYVASNLPTGTGVSSSAAIELAFLTLWNELDGLGLNPKTLALLGQRCEHEFVGVHCGVMDQMASALGREGCAMLLDTRSLEATYHRIPEGLEIVLCDTNKPRSLDATAYNDRRRECAEAARSMGLRSLRDATMASLDGTFPQKSGVQYLRARHVISENERCLGFAQALEHGDRGEIGRLMRASHESLRDDYQVSCAELDWMAEAAWAARGCVGARMTGAGFGGACVAFVETESLEVFVRDAETGFKSRSDGHEPGFLVCRAAAGAGTG